jgi:SAM-dependent methyltransferase
MPSSRPEDYETMQLGLIRQRWDQKAERWDADLADEHFHLNEDGAYRRFLETADELVAARAPFCRGRLLVDVGCGTGLVLAHFVDRFAAGLGIDISPQMLAVAQRRQLPRTHFVEGNCFALTAHVTRAGAVFGRGVLLSHYGRQWAAVLLQQIRQVLEPEGGFAILDFLNATGRGEYPGNPENKTYYRPDEIELLGHQAGFRRVAILGQPERRVLSLLADCSG